MFHLLVDLAREAQTIAERCVDALEEMSAGERERCPDVFPAEWVE